MHDEAGQGQASYFNQGPNSTVKGNYMGYGTPEKETAPLQRGDPTQPATDIQAIFLRCLQHAISRNKVLRAAIKTQAGEPGPCVS